ASGAQLLLAGTLGRLRGSAQAEGLPPSASLFFLPNQRRSMPGFCSPVVAGAASASGGAAGAGPTTSPNLLKNSPASFLAVASIRRPPSWASLPPTSAL